MHHLSTLDQIKIRGIHTYTYIGVHDFERKHKQPIVLHAILWTDTRTAGISDNLSDTVDYQAITNLILAEAEQSTAHLLEHLADKIAKICLKHDRRIAQIELTIEKPKTMLAADCICLKIVRSQQ